VKPHMPIQGHEKLHEKKREANENFKTIGGEAFLKESENGDHTFL
jgi:hypothetical protein